MSELKEEISALEQQLHNPYNNPSEELVKDVRTKKAQLRSLETEANDLRKDLDTSNSKLFEAYREQTHVPVADQKAYREA